MFTLSYPIEFTILFRCFLLLLLKVSAVGKDDLPMVQNGPRVPSTTFLVTLVSPLRLYCRLGGVTLVPVSGVSLCSDRCRGTAQCSGLSLYCPTVWNIIYYLRFMLTTGCRLDTARRCFNLVKMEQDDCRLPLVKAIFPLDPLNKKTKFVESGVNLCIMMRWPA